MTAAEAAVVEHRLVTMRRALFQIEALGQLDGHRLANDPTVGLVLERILWLLADLAGEVNRAVLGRPASFAEIARAGLIDDRLAATLTPEDPHHVLVQLALDTDPGEAAAVVTAAQAAYGDYVARVSAWLAHHAPPGQVARAGTTRQPLGPGPGPGPGSIPNPGSRQVYSTRSGTRARCP